MREVCIVHYDEVALKRGRRDYYEGRLRLAVQNAVRDLGTIAVETLYGRLLAWPGRTDVSIDVLAERISRVCGVRYVLVGLRTEPTLEALTATTLAVAAPLGPRRTFAVRVKKADSGYAYGASETERLLGAEVCARTDWKVDLGDPEVTLRVEIVNGKGFVAVRRLDGPGGLPYGTTGHGLALISGGIDSPVAAWLMMGRGLKVSAVHFHSAPFTTAASQDKVKELLRVLTRRQPSIDAAFVPFAETVQRRIVEAAPSRYRVVLYRRFMVRIAGALAEAAGATCLVTGDALGQVASQTIANLATVDAASPLPVFRPLIGLSKERIMDEARRIGTYDVSIQPDEDCCAYLMPRDPAAATTPAELLEVEKALEVESMTRAAVLAHGSFTIRFDVAEPVPRRRR